MMQSPAAGALCRPLVPPCCSAPMSVPGGRRASIGSRRRASPPVSMREPFVTSSVSSSTSGSYKGSDGSPSFRRSTKYNLCSENHGIKPPTPEQYLTPLQQKEVCIRHLRARLKDMQDVLQERDLEVDELRSQLSRMQEDWIEEECHRVEAQLALKTAQREIQQLREVMENVSGHLGDGDMGVQKYFADITLQNRKLETLLQNMELAHDGVAHGAEGGGGSAGDSPARSLTRSSTYTKLSEPNVGDRHSQDTGDSGYAAPDDSSAVSSGTEFCLGEGPLCLAVQPPPLCVEAAVQASSMSDCGVQTDDTPGTPEPDAIIEKVLQSQAAVSPTTQDPKELEAENPDPSCVVLVTDGAVGTENGDVEGPDAPLSYWSRHFVVDLLAVLIPVVPTVAWLCRAQRRQGQPVYNISSLMRGCCSVALHSIRRISCRPVSASNSQP